MEALCRAMEAKYGEGDPPAESEAAAPAPAEGGAGGAAGGDAGGGAAAKDDKMDTSS